jgi:hypothetical protein
MSRREAFRALMGVEYSGETTQFPEQIVLPELIHARALEAGNATTGDQRERSVHFRHKDGGWEAGRTFRGRKMKLKRSGRKGSRRFRLRGHPSYLHVRSALIFPPHIHLHTHPPGPEGAVEEMVGDSVEDSFRASMESIESEMLAMTVLLPSVGDITRTLAMPAGSVAHLLTSKWGRFLWVHRDIAATKEPPRSLIWTALRKRVYPLPEYVTIADQAVIPDDSDPNVFADEVADIVKDFWTISIDGRVEALDKAYVCYMVRDPEDATLCRVRVGETPTFEGELSRR